MSTAALLDRAVEMRAGLVGAGLLALLLAACGGESSPEAERDLTLGAETGRAAAPPRERAHAGQATARAAAPKRRPQAEPSRPPIVERPIPFPATRLEETAAYSQRHYGERKTRLDPKVIIEHYTVLPTADGVFSLFSQDKPDVELHELPGVCSHFLVDRDGTIYQLVPVRQICRHTVGLNDVAIGIEHVGASDQEVLNNREQLGASLRLSAWLRCRYGIGLDNVIGHSESLSSPYHHEAVAALKRQTHDDFKPTSMEQYRSRLARRTC
jgi:N-acetylmuramoyl-L-alanine amidase